MRVQTCRLCLAVEVKVFKLGTTGAIQFIMDVLKVYGFAQKLCESHFICYECKALLEKSHNFIKRVLAAQEILVDMIKNKKMTLLSLKEIDREKANISTNYMTHVLKNIDISTMDYDEYDIQNESGNELAAVEKESIASFCGSNEDLTTDHKFEVINNMVECNDSNTKMITMDIKEEDDPYTKKIITMNIKEEDDPTYSIKKNKCLQKNKKIRKPATKQLIIDVETGDVVDIKPVKKKSHSAKLEPSKFMLSLSNVGDRSERRKNKQYKLGKGEESVSSEDEQPKREPRDKNDKEYQVELTEESSESDYDLHGKKLKTRDRRVYPMKCDHCDYEVPEKRNHFKHYLYVHPDKPYPYGANGTFVCQFCGKISKRKQRHDYHELTHSSEKKYQCLLCPKKFYNAARLGQHVRVTHTTKFLECDYCGKKFKTRSDLSIHLRIHTGEKPFKCHICGAGFAHKGNVGIHIRAKHGCQIDTKQTKSAKPKRQRKRKSSSDLLQSENKKKKTTKLKRKLEIKDSSDDIENLLQLQKSKNNNLGNSEEMNPELAGCEYLCALNTN